ncbi:MAG: tetratricopeptide repeat protein, partial [Acidobacteriota bacterium]|nr:tetratricopeptide repeat protein [Acidobacteriota bacterium]
TETCGDVTDAARREGRFDAIERAQEILRPLLESHPDNLGVHHYWVHAHEYGPDPGAALDSALLLPSLAPNSGHVLHMPGHVWYQIGNYEKALEAFTVSLEFDREYLAESGVDPVDNWNYAHNLDYLVTAAAESGRYEQGRRWAETLGALGVGAGRHHAVGSGFALYGGRTALARLHMRFGAWDRAGESLEALGATGSSPSPLAPRYYAALAIYARGMSAVSRGLVTEADANLKRLLEENLALRREQANLGADWYFDAARRILAVASFELAGSLLSLQGRHEEAIVQLHRTVKAEEELGYWEPPHVARPALESLADAYLRAGRWDDARRAYDRVLELRPNSGHAMFGIARSYVLEGRKPEARKAMQRLIEVWATADPDLPQISQTREWLRANS